MQLVNLQLINFMVVGLIFENCEAYNATE